MLDTIQVNTTQVKPAAAANLLGKRVEVRNIAKRYGNFTAVNDVSFDLQAGEFLTLLGPSGSGKTSTLMMVAGFEAPTSGAISVDGRDVVALSAQKRNFGVVFQGYALFPHLTALENVEFPLQMRKYPREGRRRLAQEMLDRVGLSTMMARRPRELSGGQQQRVALARALVFRPDALLLDEPLGALDKNLRERMQAEIKDLQRTLGISILFVTHDQEEAMTMSDRIAVMNEGRIVQIGAPKEVYTRPKTAFVAGFLGETNMVPCTVSEGGKARPSITLAGGQRCHAAIADDGPAFRDNDRALLSIRPEKINLLRPAEVADFAVTGTLTEHTFVGRHFRSIVAAGGTNFVVISADASRADGVAVGDQVQMGWASGDAQLLPA